MLSHAIVGQKHNLQVAPITLGLSFASYVTIYTIFTHPSHEYSMFLFVFRT